MQSAARAQSLNGRHRDAAADAITRFRVCQRSALATSAAVGRRHSPWSASSIDPGFRREKGAIRADNSSGRGRSNFRIGHEWRGGYRVWQHKRNPVTTGARNGRANAVRIPKRYLLRFDSSRKREGTCLGQAVDRASRPVHRQNSSRDGLEIPPRL